MFSEMRRPVKDDFYKVLSDPLNEKNRILFDDKSISYLCNDPYSVVFIVKNEPVFIGGISFYWVGRAKVWSLFTSVEKQAFVPVFRLMKKYLDSLKVRRVEIDVPCDDDIAKKRAEMLGFYKYAEKARAYNHLGEDCTLFERIN